MGSGKAAVFGEMTLGCSSADQRARAIELLPVAVPYELAIPGIANFGLFGCLYPAYVRGEVLLAAREGAEAAAEFQKILDHRGIVMSDPVGAAACSQLGRAFAMSRENTKAKTAYQDFLTLWKDANPDIPILGFGRPPKTRGHLMRRPTAKPRSTAMSPLAFA
jgi:hypothetical protein